MRNASGGGLSRARILDPKKDGEGGGGREKCGGMRGGVYRPYKKWTHRLFYMRL